MKRTIRQVFGTTRPRDIWLNLFTFDQMLTRPIIHIVYWCGLGLLFIFALGWLGIMVGTGIKDASIMGWLLSFGLLAFSSTPFIRAIGQVQALGIVSAVALALLLRPPATAAARE